MNIRLICVAFLLLTIDASAFEPPKLISASPSPWAVGVPAATKNVSLTFDQQMAPGVTAWLGRSSLAPEVDLNSKISDDRKTFELKVSLQPGKVYVLGLNERGLPGVGFQNDKGLALPPTFLVFQTAGSPPPDEMPPRVVSTTPGSGAQNLDPTKLKSITINFDRAMQPSKHGLHMRENGIGVDLSKARFQYSADGKAFTVACELKPSSTYEFELNNTQDIGFTSTKRIPLWPVRFAFSTGQ